MYFGTTCSQTAVCLCGHYRSCSLNKHWNLTLCVCVCVPVVIRTGGQISRYAVGTAREVQSFRLTQLSASSYGFLYHSLMQPLLRCPPVISALIALQDCLRIQLHDGTHRCLLVVTSKLSLWPTHFFGQFVPGTLTHCFSTFVRPRPGKFFFHKTRARSQQSYS